MKHQPPHPYYTFTESRVEEMERAYPASQPLERQAPLTRTPVTRAYYRELKRKAHYWGPERERLFHDAHYIVDDPPSEPTPDTGPGIVRTMAATVAKVFRVFVPEPEKPPKPLDVEPTPPKRGSTFFTRP